MTGIFCAVILPELHLTPVHLKLLLPEIEKFISQLLNFKKWNHPFRQDKICRVS